ncbi:MAG: lactate racemase domain-containing protein, partial [Elusimicrobiota bacterium]|nr:lactate racemase domain-containing protein [Elusimicrobiota bacterium]
TDEIILTYGKETISGFIPQSAIDNGKFIPLILPKKLPVIRNPQEALSRALENPVGNQKPLSQLVKENYRGGDVSIITDDHDRPNIHTRLLLPILIEMLNSKYKIPNYKIKVVIATGTHRPSTSEELETILGKGMPEKLNIVIHKCKENVVEAGKVNGQTIKINQTVFNSDIIIPLTDVENHYFAGVAGGPKSFCPGVCDMDTITYEHLHMFGPEGFEKNVGLGIGDGNPVFETKKKIVKTIIDTLKSFRREVYTIATIIDTEDDLVYLKGGEIFELHCQAAEVLKNVWTVYTEEKPEIVIASASVWGVDLYQMGKATHTAYRAVKKGGIILTVAPCSEGWGNEEFKNLMRIGMAELNKYDDKNIGVKEALSVIIDIVKKDFKIGKQKPVDIFQILNYVGYGNMHIIQDGVPESDWNLLPFVFWGKASQPVVERLKSWIEKHLQDKTITVINNPGYLVKSLE